MFTAALFIIVKTWKQLKYPWRDEWIKKMCMHTMEYYFTTKKKEQNNAMCSKMDGTRDSYTK